MECFDADNLSLFRDVQPSILSFASTKDCLFSHANSLNVFAYPFPVSHVNGVATGLASSSDKVAINASTCLEFGR